MRKSHMSYGNYPFTSKNKQTYAFGKVVRSSIGGQTNVKTMETVRAGDTYYGIPKM